MFSLGSLETLNSYSLLTISLGYKFKVHKPMLERILSAFNPMCHLWAWTYALFHRELLCVSITSDDLQSEGWISLPHKFWDLLFDLWGNHRAQMWSELLQSEQVVQRGQWADLKLVWFGFAQVKPALPCIYAFIHWIVRFGDVTQTK